MTIAERSIAEARAHCAWSRKPLTPVESTAVAIWRHAENGFGWRQAAAMCYGAAALAVRNGDDYGAQVFAFLSVIACELER